METKNDHDVSRDHLPLAAAAPLSPTDARRAENEARQQAASTGAELFNAQHRMKAEAEMRRISEEVTREAQERRRAAQVDVPSSPSDGLDTDQEALTSGLAPYLPPPMLIKHIAVPLDGSAFAERALPYATALAMMAGARLSLAHVEMIPNVLDTLIAGAGSPNGQRHTPDARSYLESLRGSSPLGRQRVRVVVQRAISPALGIRMLKEDGLADVVVMATHAREGIERALLGSTADELLRAGQVPVLAVSPRVAAPLTAIPRLAHILVTLDGSLLSEQALAALGGLLSHAAGVEHAPREITLLTVVAHPALVADGESYLAAVRRLLETRYPLPGLAIHTATRVGDPAAVIAGVVPHQDASAESALTADLLILATHGRGGAGRWLLGSVASSVLQQSSLPLLLVHPLMADR